MVVPACSLGVWFWTLKMIWPIFSPVMVYLCELVRKAKTVSPSQYSLFLLELLSVHRGCLPTGWGKLVVGTLYIQYHRSSY